jgi:hypothetical protein
VTTNEKGRSEQELHGSSTRVRFFVNKGRSTYLIDIELLTGDRLDLRDFGSFRALCEVPVEITLGETS